MSQQPVKIATIDQLRQVSRQWRSEGHQVGLVPTMGALHEGHLSLMRRSAAENQRTIATIFVNPTQFGPGEDLERYPRRLEQDLQLAGAAGADVVFVPDNAGIYPPGFSTRVKPPNVAGKLEGESRQGHFEGVATIVLKLFNIAMANRAYFGQKDYQQAVMIQQMVRDLNHPVEVMMCPIVRDPDGLALSSRNVYLSEEERQIALGLNRTLLETAGLIREGENDGRVLMAHMTQNLIECGVTETDYATIADAATLDTLENVRFPCVLLLAARVGATRLIDNMLLTEP